MKTRYSPASHLAFTLLALAPMAPFRVAAKAADAPAASTATAQGEPTSPLAKAARKKHDEALAGARTAWLRARLDAEQQLIDALDNALGVVMQAKDLPEANRVAAAKAEAEKRRDAILAETKGGVPASDAAAADEQAKPAAPADKAEPFVAKGRVTDSAGQPVAGADVVVKNTLFRAAVPR